MKRSSLQWTTFLLFAASLFLACICMLSTAGCSAAGIRNFLHGGNDSKRQKSSSQHEFLDVSLNAGIGMSVLLILAAYPVFKLENAKAGWTCLTTGLIDLILCLWLNTITSWLAWAAGLVLFAVAIWVAVELYRKRNPLNDAEKFLSTRHFTVFGVETGASQTIPSPSTGSVQVGLTNAQLCGVRPTVSGSDRAPTAQPLTQP